MVLPDRRRHRPCPRDAAGEDGDRAFATFSDQCELIRRSPAVVSGALEHVA